MIILLLSLSIKSLSQSAKIAFYLSLQEIKFNLAPVEIITQKKVMDNFKKIKLPQYSQKIILALGAESAGNFSVYKNGKIYTSENFGDLLNKDNFIKFQEEVSFFLKANKLKPRVILTDLHPEMETTSWGEILAKKFKAEHIKIQHHYAHIFSQIQPKQFFLKSNTIYGVALDGTGYGLDEKIWGGEVFKFINTESSKSNQRNKIFQTQTPKNIICNLQRIGHLENQTMLGGDLAIREPARILIAILDKFLNKDIIYSQISQFYSKNQFELLYNQLQQKFNCQETSSTGRILDAVAVLLGFAKNERLYKHQATDLLEKNSTKPYFDLKPKIRKITDSGRISSIASDTIYELSTTHLFKYLIKNLHRDKHRLATTAQIYIAQGLYKIIKKHSLQKNTYIILSGGISDNKIISNYFKSQRVLVNEKSDIARGDAGLSYGQIICLLSQKSVSKLIFCK